ncbi:hypothetical protein MKW94_023790 [Papaver nudicaule]|uniref:Uncharacterized protein n=1 Tax=Papaver nudicaule TaxID=74823 RepID=A0AA41RX35_PAPNU|nr:hypothetical protein [Papaver nudicaule]
MASFKQFSLAHILIALIFSFILVSSSVNAVRLMDDGDCHYLGHCRNNKDCHSQCEKAFKSEAGLCIGDPRDANRKPQRSVCCCKNI